METALRWALGQLGYTEMGSMEREAKLNTKCLEQEVERVRIDTYNELYNTLK